MRTFHTSGAVSLSESNLVVRAQSSGTVVIEEQELCIVVHIGTYDYLVHKGTTKLLTRTGAHINEGDCICVYEDADLQNEDIAATLPLLESYFDARKVPAAKKALHAITTGVVQLEAVPEGIQISIGAELVGVVKASPILVYQGQCVEAGHKLSFGITDVQDFYESSRNLAAATELFTGAVLGIYKSNGIHVNSNHAEVLFRAMTELVQGDVIGLRRYHDDGEILLKGVTAVSREYPSWLKGTTFGWVKQHITNAVLQGTALYDLPSEKIMRGERLCWKE